MLSRFFRASATVSLFVKNEDENSSSLCEYVRINGLDYLFTGDIDETAETEILSFPQKPFPNRDYFYKLIIISDSLFLITCYYDHTFAINKV